MLAGVVLRRGARVPCPRVICYVISVPLTGQHVASVYDVQLVKSQGIT